MILLMTLPDTILTPTIPAFPRITQNYPGSQYHPYLENWTAFRVLPVKTFYSIDGVDALALPRKLQCLEASTIATITKMMLTAPSSILAPPT